MRVDKARNHPIRVVVVDDHPLALEGTQNLLAKFADIDVVGTATTGHAAIAMVQSLKPAVVVLDLRLPDISGVEVARQVRASCATVAILALTGYDEVNYMRALAQLGVQGYLAKTATSDDIVNAVRALARGQILLARNLASPDYHVTVEDLTQRELDVLKLVVVGLRNKEIAEELNVSIKTVEYHMGHIFGKLLARSRAEVINKAVALGLVPGSR